MGHLARPGFGNNSIRSMKKALTVSDSRCTTFKLEKLGIRIVNIKPNRRILNFE